MEFQKLIDDLIAELQKTDNALDLLNITFQGNIEIFQKKEKNLKQKVSRLNAAILHLKDVKSTVEQDLGEK